MTTDPEQRHEANSVEDGAKAALAAWMSLQRPLFSLMTEVNGRLFQEAMKANSEWLTLVGQRFERDLETSRRMMQCRTVKDVIGVYADFLRGSQEQTRIEITTLSRINQSMADEAVAAMRSGLDDAAQELRH